ncbi:hypothetical protein FACS1894201_07020 [Bacteroidia bacterium]|nr:hypothetical protein FACS1894201_07020 [Bacteroidia bacterium]
MHGHSKLRIDSLLVVAVLVILVGCKGVEQTVQGTQAAESAVQLQQPAYTLTRLQQLEVENLFIEATNAFVADDYAQAIQLYYELLKIDPDNAATNYQISRLQSVGNKPLDAEIYAEKAARLDPTNKFYLENLVGLYRTNRKYKRAIDVLNQLYAIDSREMNYLRDMISLYLAINQPLGAIAVYDTLEAKIGITDEFSKQKHRLYSVMNDTASAHNELRKLLTVLQDTDVQYWSVLATLRLQEQNYDAALHAFNEVLRLDPDDTFTHLALADHYQMIDDTIRFHEEVRKIFTLSDIDIDFKIRALMPYFEITDTLSKDYRLAYQLLDTLKRYHPEDPKTYSIYGDFLRRDNKFTEALTMFHKVIDLGATQYLIWEALLLCELALLDSVALVNDATKALDLYPEQPLVYYMLAVGYQLQHEWQLAVQYLEQGVLLVAQNKALKMQFYSDLAEVYSQLKDYDRSFNNYRLALKIDPDNYTVLNNFSYNLAVQKIHLDEAETMSQKVVRANPLNATFLDTFAWVLFQKGKYKEAKSVMELAIEQSGVTEAVLLEHYGDILWKNNEQQKAVDFWIKAKNLNQEGTTMLLDQKIDTRTWIEE